MQKNIEEMIRPLLERLCRGIFKRRTKVAMGLNAITQKPMEIQESNNSEEGVGVVLEFMEATTSIGETT